jgi:hypothetical protein
MPTLVLLSGGLDSAVLAAHEAQTERVLPVYVSVGLAWEDAEVSMVEQLLASPAFAGKVDPLARVSFTMRDVYSPTHWAIRGSLLQHDNRMKTSIWLDEIWVLLTKAGVVAAKARRIASRFDHSPAIHFPTHVRHSFQRCRSRFLSGSITRSR